MELTRRELCKSFIIAPFIGGIPNFNITSNQPQIPNWLNPAISKLCDIKLYGPNQPIKPIYRKAESLGKTFTMSGIMYENVLVPLYNIELGIDYLVKSRQEQIDRYEMIFHQGFSKKIEHDLLHCILCSITDAHHTYPFAIHNKHTDIDESFIDGNYNYSPTEHFNKIDSLGDMKPFLADIGFDYVDYDALVLSTVKGKKDKAVLFLQEDFVVTEEKIINDRVYIKGKMEIGVIVNNYGHKLFLI